MVGAMITNIEKRRGTLAASVQAAALILLVIDPATPALAEDAALVRVETVRTEPLTQTVPVIGRFVALRSGDVAARIDAPVKQLLAEVGDVVRKSEVIAILDDEILQAERALAESEFLESKAEVVAWAAEADQAQTELDRQARLKKSTAFSQARFEDAQKKMAVATARIKRAEAKMAIKSAGLRRKALEISYATVRAPYEGVIVRRHTDAGAYVSKGDAIVKIIGSRSLEIEADVPFRRLGGLVLEREVDIKLDDGSKHTATVRAVLPSENPLTRTRAVRLRPKMGTTVKSLAESQSVIVAVPVGLERRVLTVHKDAILNRQGANIVYVVADGVASPRTLLLGEAVGSRMEVVSGLKAGEKIVVRGNERLTPGAKVRIEKGSS